MVNYLLNCVIVQKKIKQNEDINTNQTQLLID